MYYNLYNLVIDAIFDGTVPSLLVDYLIEFFVLFCILVIVGIPFMIIYAFVRRVL